jgi:hypothetical protein
VIPYLVLDCFPDSPTSELLITAMLYVFVSTEKLDSTRCLDLLLASFFNLLSGFIRWVSTANGRRLAAIKRKFLA